MNVQTDTLLESLCILITRQDYRAGTFQSVSYGADCGSSPAIRRAFSTNWNASTCCSSTTIPFTAAFCSCLASRNALQNKEAPYSRCPVVNGDTKTAAVMALMKHWRPVIFVATLQNRFTKCIQHNLTEKAVHLLLFASLQLQLCRRAFVSSQEHRCGAPRCLRIACCSM